MQREAEHRMLERRVFLFLQGPVGPFFRTLAQELQALGHKVIRVNLSGGDLIDWAGGECINYHGRYRRWPSWIARLMEQEGVTDLMLMGDWRPKHCEAVEIAKFLGIRVVVFEEGYLRPWYITMEEGGVNGTSPLPHNPDAIRSLARTAQAGEEPVQLTIRSRLLGLYTIRFLAGRCLFWPLFPFYKNHRPYSIFKEYIQGWIPRLLGQKKQTRRTEANLRRLHASGMPYYLFPLQLDSDAQVRRYSPFSGMRDGISHIMVSFAKYAPKDTALVVKNHPLDCGLINYYRYVREYARALRIHERVFFLESGDNKQLIEQSLGLVLLNSTFGAQALSMGKPVYYVGKGICAMQGLGACEPSVTLQEYWQNPVPPDSDLWLDFTKVLKERALVNGDFLTLRGRRLACKGIIQRLGISPVHP